MLAGSPLHGKIHPLQLVHDVVLPEPTTMNLLDALQKLVEFKDSNERQIVVKDPSNEEKSDAKPLGNFCFNIGDNLGIFRTTEKWSKGTTNKTEKGGWFLSV